MFRLSFFAAGSLALLAACQTDMSGGVPAPEDFSMQGVSIAPLATANLCSDIGGQGVQPSLTITHSAAAGVPVRVRMYDVHNDGSVTEHGVVNTQTEADGSTVVNSGFRPPCNTTNGRRNSSYRFDVAVGGQSTTTRWGDYDSAARRIR